MFLSIIIPVYNGASSIKRCLDSIWSQGLPDNDYEVVCVDDCSKDNSLKILAEIQQRHPQLRVIKNQTNLRAGGARNHGVRESKGKYILFIDIDDFFNVGMVKFAYDYQSQKQLDILMLDMSRQKNANEFPIATLNFPNHNVLDGISFIEVNTCPFGPTKFIFKKELMVQTGIWFEENCCCEDVDWCFRLILHSKSIQYLPYVLSIYLLNDLSTTANEHTSIRTVSDKFRAAKRLVDSVLLLGGEAA